MEADAKGTSFVHDWVDWGKRTLFVLGVVWVLMCINANYFDKDGEVGISLPGKASYKLGAR